MSEQVPHNPATPATPASPDQSGLAINRNIPQLKRRLVKEATLAVSMLEGAVAAMFAMDAAGAKAVRLSDDQVDSEEVAIEQACYQILALRAPYARDFRELTFILRANADVERVADHASSLAKCASKIADAAGGVEPSWPTALRELGERVPLLCHTTLRAVLDEDVDAARRIVESDRVIDNLEKRLFEETIESMRGGPNGDANLAIGLLFYRAGRELERVGDLMASIAEDTVYLATAEIIRHAKRRGRPRAPRPADDRPPTS
ncbi:MAG: phosphate signaling complex protein PhoU [Tepidisphaera sp.]|nr:phosphate signaling complex protein PhoU [Tepidisphaera sp.]